MIRSIGRALGASLLRAATWSASALGYGSAYNATNPRRKILNASRRPGSYSARELATNSLPDLRRYARQLERNNPVVRAAVEGQVATVIGTGIALEPEFDNPEHAARISAAWNDYIRSCTVDGRDLYDLQRQGFREVFNAGALLWRFVQMPERLQSGEIPLVVLPLEVEWIDGTANVATQVTKDTVQVGGITTDRYGRPTHYRLRCPDTALSSDVETVSAANIVHVFEKRRALQTDGEPWVAPVIETLEQEADLIATELKAANNSASFSVFVKSPFHADPDTTTHGMPDDPAESIALGAVVRGLPGDELQTISHTRPSQQIMPFRNGLRGDEAGALRISQRWLNRDYSQASYSSLRSCNLDDERLVAPVREWFGHGTAGRLYREVLPYLCAMTGVPMPKKIRYRLIPDGQPYVDPLKDAQASAIALAAGLTTWEAEIGKRGGDYREVWKQLAAERAQAAALGLTLDLSGSNAPAPESTAGTVPADQAAAQQSTV